MFSPHPGSCEGKPAPAERNPSRFGKGLPGSSPYHKGFMLADPAVLPVPASRWRAATSLPKGIQKKLSRSEQYCLILSVACSAPACKPPVRGQGCSKPEPKGPVPSSHLPNHTSRHSSTHSTHPKILHISQCPDMTATGASPLLTAAHPAEPSFPVRHSSSPLPPAHTAQPAPLGSNLTVRSHTEGCRQYFPKHHLSLWTLQCEQFH